MREDEGTIFIVDDDEAVRDSLGLLMRSLGYRARCYPSGEAFLEAFDPKAFGCLVLDIRLPVFDRTALQIQQELTDPLLRELFRMDGTFFDLKLYQDGQIICQEGMGINQAAATPSGDVLIEAIL